MSSSSMPSAVRRSTRRLAVARRSSTPEGGPDSDIQRAMTFARYSFNGGSTSSKRAFSSGMELIVGRCLQSGNATGRAAIDVQDGGSGFRLLHGHFLDVRSIPVLDCRPDALPRAVNYATWAGAPPGHPGLEGRWTGRLTG